MAHNLHLILINAESIADAAQDALDRIEDWGDENNWRAVGGVISSEGTFLTDTAGQWNPDFFNESLTENYYQAVKDYIKSQIPTLEDLEAEIVKIGNELIALNLKLDKAFPLYPYYTRLKEISELRDARRQLDKGNELPSWNSWQFDEIGLTDLTEYAETGTKSTSPTYIVLLDMHS